MSAAVAGTARMVGHDVNTGQIYHGYYSPLNNSAEMAMHTMEYVPGLENLAQEVKESAMLLNGGDFGCGSFREHAVLCLQHAEVILVIAYFATAGRQIQVGLLSGTSTDLDTDRQIDGKSLYGLECQITEKGGLLPCLKVKVKE